MLSASFRRQLPRWVPADELHGLRVPDTHPLVAGRMFSHWLETWLFTEMFSLAVLSTPGHIILM